MFFYRYADGTLEPVGAIDGFSNHAIGSREMRLSAVADVNGDGRADLVLPSNDRDVLRIVGFENARPIEIARVALPARVDKAIAVRGAGADTRFIVGLDNAGVYEIHR